MILKNPIELEDNLREICRTDPSNPELYTKIVDLALTIMMSRSLANYDEMDYIAHDLASDLYLKINQGEIIIYNWRKYIRLRCMSYRDNFRKMNGIQIFNIPDVVKEREMITNLYSASLSLASMSNIREISDIVEEIPKIVDGIIDKVIKYKSYRTVGSIKLSVYLSLVNNKPVFIDTVSAADREYISFLCKVVKKNLFGYLCDELKDTSYFNEWSLKDSLSDIGFSESSQEV